MPRIIDATQYHDPARAPELIATAIAKAGSQKALAARLDVTPRYLQMLARRKYDMSYPLQVALEVIADESTDKA